MSSKLHTRVSVEDESGERVDKWLASWTQLSRARIKALIEDEQVRADGELILSPTTKVKPGIEYGVFVPPPIDDTPLPQDIPLDILFEDDQLIVVNNDGSSCTGLSLRDPRQRPALSRQG